jgi:N-acetylneuraminate synthase
VIAIAGRPIGPGHPPFVVAEISCNHLGRKDWALWLIREARDAGADAVKFQLYTPDDMAEKDGPPLTSGPWAGRTLYDLYTEAMTPRDWFLELFALARECGLIPFTSVFNPADIPFLESLNCPAYKIASAEIGWLDLIQACAATGKPVILSTGMADQGDGEGEITRAVDAADLSPVALLHCVSAYPTAIRDANLWNLKRLRGYPVATVGISDHSLGDIVPIAATALGACVIEKHLMLPETHPLDEGHSLTPDQFRRMVQNVQATWAAMQQPKGDAEQASRQFKRRLINGRWLRECAEPAPHA